MVVCSFQCLSGNDIRHMTEEDFRLSCCAKSFSSYSFLGRNRECLVRTDIAVSESTLSVYCSPSLLSVKTWVFCSSFLYGRVFVSGFVWE